MSNAVSAKIGASQVDFLGHKISSEGILYAGEAYEGNPGMSNTQTSETCPEFPGLGKLLPEVYSGTCLNCPTNMGSVEGPSLCMGQRTGRRIQSGESMFDLSTCTTTSKPRKAICRKY